MLDVLRKKKESWVSVFIILAVVVVMGFFGVSKFQDEANGNGPAVWVNGEVITRRDFAQALEGTLAQYRAMLGAQYDEKLLGALQIPQRTLDRLVQYRLVAQQAKKMGIIISDSELADHIRSQPYFQKNGKFDAALYSKIPNRGLEEKRQRDDMAVQRLETYLSDRIRMTPAELERGHVLKNTHLELEYAAIDFQSLIPKTTVSAQEVATYMEQAPAAELKDYYEAHRDDFTEKAQIEFRQIRVAVPFQANDATRAEAKKKMEGIVQGLNADNFEATAKAKSDDEYAKKGGHRGWVAKGTLEKPLEDALDKLAPKQVSPIVDTPFGFFALQLLGRKDAVVTPLENVRKDIALKILEQKSRTDASGAKRKAWEDKLAQGQSLDADLKQNKIELKKTGSFSAGQGSIPGIGNVDSMLDAAFELTKEKPIAPKLYLFHDKYYYLKLVSLTPAKAADFAKEKDVVEKALISALQGELLSRWIQGLEKQATVKKEVSFDGSAPVHDDHAEL